MIMTKLEKQLINMGYEYQGHYYYSKKIDDNLTIVLQAVDYQANTSEVKTSFYEAKVKIYMPIPADETNNLQQALDTLKNDLKELSKC